MNKEIYTVLCGKNNADLKSGEWRMKMYIYRLRRISDAYFSLPVEWMFSATGLVSNNILYYKVYTVL